MRALVRGKKTHFGFLAIAATIIIWGCFGGCGGGGGGGGGTGPGQVQLAIISGEIDVSGISTAIGDPTARISSAWNFSNSTVFLEENPLFNTTPDSQGRFVIEQVPAGTYHLIVRLSSTLMPSYKMRLETPFQITSGVSPPSTKIAITEADKADSQVSILVVNPFGLAVPGTKVTIWGEAFTDQGNGVFLSPLMPAKTAGTIVIEPPIDSELQKQSFSINSGTFVKNEFPSLGITLIPTGVVNRPPNVWLKPEKTVVKGGDLVTILSSAQDPDLDQLVPSWTAAVGSFPETSIDKAVWEAPDQVGSVTIVFSVTEKTSKFPNFTSKAAVEIRIATTTTTSTISTFSVDIIGTATIQIPGGMIARYDAIASGGTSASYTYSWSVTNGTIMSGETTSSLIWKAPPLQQGQTQFATITVSVSDGQIQATKSIVPSIVAAPNVEIVAPVDPIQKVGNIEFIAAAVDFDGSPLDATQFKWYLGTDTFTPRLQTTGKDRFTYYFTAFRNYQILFTAKNSRGVTATTTKQITIQNTPPQCTIQSPQDNSAFTIGQIIPFIGSASDYEDGYISADSKLEWGSNLAGTFSRGLFSNYASLASGQHLITFLARDSSAFTAIATISIIVTNLPLMNFSPPQGATFFAETPIQFQGYGTDSKNISILPSAMNWYLNGTLWKSGVASFSTSPGDIPPGTNSVKLEGTDVLGKVGNTVHTFLTGIASPAILLPASGSVFVLNATVNCLASPTDVASIGFSWYSDFGTPQQAFFGRTRSARISTLTRGLHTLTYLGTDSQNLANATSVMVLVNAPPTLQATPSNSAVFFGGNNISFSGSGMESDGATPISAGNMRWYLDSALWKSGTAAFSATPAEISTAVHQIDFSAQDQFGIYATLTPSITAGYSLPQISSPSAFASYSVNVPLNFQGTPDSKNLLTMVWWASSTVPVQIGAGSSITYTFTTPGTFTLTYLGTDSEGFLGSFSRQIYIENIVPVMAFTPVDNSILFGGQPVYFSGAGTESNNIVPIPTANLRWYNAPGSLWKTATSSFLTAVDDLSTGTHKISLQGKDSRSLTGEATNSIYVGYDLPSITSPSSGTIFAPGAAVALNGTPDSSGPITMTWFANSMGSLGAGGSINPTFNRGRYDITYIGTDSQNFAPIASISIVVNASPAMTFNPTQGIYVFNGATVPFSGSGVDASGTPIDPAKMKWYKNGPLIINGTSSFNSGPASFSGAGDYSISLSGEDNFGFVGSAGQTFYYGHTLASITSPASGTFVGVGVNQNFTAVPDSNATITMTWYQSNGGAPAAFGSGQAATGNFGTRGIWLISYSGTDSLGNLSSQTIPVNVGNPPTMTFTPNNGYIVFNGFSVPFSGSGLDGGGGPILAADMKWYRNSSLIRSGVSNFTSTPASFTGPGSYMIDFTGKDNLGFVGTTTQTFYYGFTGASITSPASGTKVNITGNVNFTGVPDSSGTIIMTWYRSDGISTSTMGTGQSTNDTFNTRGIQYISYSGVDSLGNVSSHTIPIVVDDPPTMTFTPGNAYIVFNGFSVPFNGSGLDAGGGPILAADMMWYRNSSLIRSGVSNFISTPASFTGAGSYKIDFTGKDNLGFVGTTTQTFYYGFATPSITSPASGTRVDISDNVNFTGVPDSSGTLITNWYRTDGVVATFPMGNGQSTSNVFNARGIQYISYCGADSFNNGASHTIPLIVDTPPTMDFTPPNNAILFANTAVTFTGNGTNSAALPAPILAANMKWYKDGGIWQSGVNTFVANPGTITNGSHTIYFQGTDDLGVIGSASHYINYGYTAASITSPASGTRYDTGVTVTFTATPSYIPDVATFTWVLDYTDIVATNSTTYASDTIASGWHTLTYYGTDSAYNVSSSTIGVWINTLPTITAILVTAPTQFATGPAGEKIFTRIGGAGLGFSSSATDFEVNGGASTLPGAAMSWFIAGDPATKTTGLTFNWIVNTPASLTIRCVATDSWGFSVSTSTVLWDWEWEQYGVVSGNFPPQPGPLNGGIQLNNPTGIQTINATNLVVSDIGNNRLIKIVRDNTGALTTDGDLTGAATDTYYPFASNLIDSFFYSNQLFTLETNAPVYLKTIDSTSFNTVSTITYPVGADNLVSPVGVARGAGAYYVADGVGIVRRIDSTNGAFFAQQAAIAAPFRLRLDAAGTFLYITDQTNDKLYKYSNSLNPTAKIWEVTATSATDIALTTNYILVSDTAGASVTAFLLTDGSYAFEFGNTPANPLVSPSGLAIVSGDNDLYIVEETNPGRITRIRSHQW